MANDDTYYNSPDSDFKGSTIKHVLGKLEYDLFKEADDKVESMLRVKRSGSDESEKWKISEDKTVVYTLEGPRLSSKEREFLRTPEGMQLLIKLHKTEQKIKSISFLKSEIRKAI